jgi:co-chaperonin GroES (HSP10)
MQLVSASIPESRLPQPVGWRVLIEPVKVEEKTKGGIVLAHDTVKAKEHLRYLGRVVAMGSLCYSDERFHGERWCDVGDYVAYGQYAGQEVVIRDTEAAPVKLRLVNDDEILARIPEPEAVLIYAW